MPSKAGAGMASLPVIENIMRTITCDMAATFALRKGAAIARGAP